MNEFAVFEKLVFTYWCPGSRHDDHRLDVHVDRLRFKVLSPVENPVSPRCSEL